MKNKFVVNMIINKFMKNKFVDDHIKKKLNNFEYIVESFLVYKLFEFLDKNDIANSLLYCSKILNESIINVFIKRNNVNYSIAKKWLPEKRQKINHLCVDLKYDFNFKFSNLLSIIFECDNTFVKPLEPGILSNSLKEITFGHCFNQIIKPGTLPESLKKLKFGNSYNHSLSYRVYDDVYKTILPVSLTHLIFSKLSHFNQRIDNGALIESLTHINFGFFFNQQLYDENNMSVLSSLRFLKELTFGYSFNQKLSNPSGLKILPDSLNKLSFGCEFNQTIVPGILPNSLTHLVFGLEFNKPLVPHTLPESLTVFLFEDKFKKTLSPDILPIFLRDLKF